MQRSQRTLLTMFGVAALAVLWARAAAAEIPALSREFRTENYIADQAQLESVLAQRHLTFAASGGSFFRGDDPGSANAFGSWKQVGGGTLDAAVQLGRFGLGANGIADTKRMVDDREFPQRAYASAYMPEARASVVGSVGFGEGRYAGVDLTAEVLAARVKAIQQSADVYPRIWMWTRLRHLDFGNRTVLTPAIGIFIQHAIVVGSQVYLGISAQSDLADNVLPVTSGMFQAGWGTVPHPLWSHGDPDAPGAEVSNVNMNWFATLAYAVPFDTRDDARFTAQVGIRLLRPFGS